MSGASGPSTSPRPTVARAASTMLGTMFGSVLPMWRPSRGEVTSVAGKAHDRERHRQPGEAQHRQEPPPGRSGEAQPFGKVREHADLDLVDEPQEPPRGERHHDTDDRREHEQRYEPLAPKHRGRIRCTRRGLSQTGLPPNSTSRCAPSLGEAAARKPVAANSIREPGSSRRESRAPCDDPPVPAPWLASRPG